MHIYCSLQTNARQNYCSLQNSLLIWIYCSLQNNASSKRLDSSRSEVYKFVPQKLRRVQISSAVYGHIDLFIYLFVIKERGRNDVKRGAGGLMV